MLGLWRRLKDRVTTDNSGNTPDMTHKYYTRYINIDMIGDTFISVTE